MLFLILFTNLIEAGSVKYPFFVTKLIEAGSVKCPFFVTKLIEAGSVKYLSFYSLDMTFSISKQITNLLR